MSSKRNNVDGRFAWRPKGERPLRQGKARLAGRGGATGKSRNATVAQGPLSKDAF